MTDDRPIKATAAEVALQFSHFTDAALTHTVIVTKNGRDRNVILSIDAYNRLIMRRRHAFKTENTPSVFLDEIDKLIETLPEI